MVSRFNELELTAEIVSAFVSNNSIPKGELPGLFETVHLAITGLSGPRDSVTPLVETQAPAVSIRKSITPDYLICLDDGKRYKSLKRHLRGLGMTPDQYRLKWSLPTDYPMVAPNYATQRSELAKQIGLGQLRKKAPVAKVESVIKSKVGRPRKTLAT